MLIAVKIQNDKVEMYHWEVGGCATINSDGWAGWTTSTVSSHPAQSENEFLHKCLTSPGKFFIRVDETGILIKENDTVVLEQGIEQGN